jgi:hypothetical protein
VSLRPILMFLAVSGLALFIALMSGLQASRWITSGTMSAEALSASVAVAGLVLTIFAIAAAFLTIHQEQVESQRQRRMETLHLLTSEYERIFDEIYAEIGKTDHHDPHTLRRLHNKYFTAVHKGFRSFRAGLVEEADFIDWTAALIARFERGTHLLDLTPENGAASLSEQWADFDRRAASPRDDFRVYMEAIKKTAAAPGYNPRADARALLKTLKKRRYQAENDASPKPVAAEAAK